MFAKLMAKAKLGQLAAQVASIAVLPLFTYANVQCIADTALGVVHHSHPATQAQSVVLHHHDEDGPQSADHHGNSDSSQGHQHNDDPLNCCSTFTAVSSATQPTVAKPDLNPAACLFVVAVSSDLGGVIPVAISAYDHGPPEAAPPQFLSVNSISPRAPPLSV